MPLPLANRVLSREKNSEGGLREELYFGGLGGKRREQEKKTRTSGAVQEQRPSHHVTSGISQSLWAQSLICEMDRGLGCELSREGPLRIWRDEVSALKRNQHFAL